MNTTPRDFVRASDDPECVVCWCNRPCLCDKDAEIARLRQLLIEARFDLTDKRLEADEYAPRKRGQTRQEQDDDQSSAMEENECRRDLIRRIDAEIAQNEESEQALRGEEE